MQFKTLVGASALTALVLASSNVFAANDGWQGFYAGAAVGSREQKADWKQDGRFKSAFDGSEMNIGQTLKNSSKDDAGYVALYGGYNWLIGERVVAGVELAGGYANNKSDKNEFTIPSFSGLFRSGTTVTVKSDWDASLRGRLGFLVTPSTLLYGTGGLAATRMNATGSCSSIGIICGVPVKHDESETLLGWTAGFGVETTLTERLVARAEYQYTDYENASFWAPEVKSNEAFGMHNKVDLTTQTVTLGLAYRF
jgi:outer membrane immunogenic protein